MANASYRTTRYCNGIDSLNSGSGVTDIEVALPDDLMLPAVLAVLAILPSNFAQTEQLS